MVSDHTECNFERLRYLLGGDRPSQTTHHALSPSQIMGAGEKINITRVVFQG